LGLNCVIRVYKAKSFQEPEDEPPVLEGMGILEIV
jgi:hypothetical protein